MPRIDARSGDRDSSAADSGSPLYRYTRAGTSKPDIAPVVETAVPPRNVAPEPVAGPDFGPHLGVYQPSFPATTRRHPSRSGNSVYGRLRTRGRRRWRADHQPPASTARQPRRRSSARAATPRCYRTPKGTGPKPGKGLRPCCTSAVTTSWGLIQVVQPHRNRLRAVGRSRRRNCDRPEVGAPGQA